MNAVALVGYLALLALAALAGWYARSWDNDVHALGAVHAWQAHAAALRAERDQIHAALRAAGHKRIPTTGTRAPVCLACKGRCQYAPALDPTPPALVVDDPVELWPGTGLVLERGYQR